MNFPLKDYDVIMTIPREKVFVMYMMPCDYAVQVVATSPRYLRVEFDAGKTLPASVDDGEFYFTPGDALVQFRCARRSGLTDFGANRRRMDGIRLALNFESVRARGGVGWGVHHDITRAVVELQMVSRLHLYRESLSRK